MEFTCILLTEAVLDGRYWDFKFLRSLSTSFQSYHEYKLYNSVIAMNNFLFKLGWDFFFFRLYPSSAPNGPTQGHPWCFD